MDDPVPSTVRVTMGTEADSLAAPADPVSPQRCPLPAPLPQEVPTLRQLWARGQQVLLSYEEEGVVRRHPELWPGVPYWWGNEVKAEKLVRYLERMKGCGRPGGCASGGRAGGGGPAPAERMPSAPSPVLAGGLFVAGINLTENLEFVLAHPAGSLKDVTLRGLPRLGAWVREQRPGPGPRCTNIIAGDFVGTSGFVGDVIRLNDKLLAG